LNSFTITSTITRGISEKIERRGKTIKSPKKTVKNLSGREINSDVSADGINSKYLGLY
jgi:hypothetical protein